MSTLTRYLLPFLAPGDPTAPPTAPTAPPVAPAVPAPVSGESPFKGIVPDFTIFGADFTTWWQKLFAGLLACLLIYTGARLVIALASMHKAQGSSVAGQVDEAKGKVVNAAIAFAGVICFVPLSIAVYAALT